MLKTMLAALTALYLLTGCDSSTPGTAIEEDPTLLGLSNYTQVELNSTQQYSLAFMWHEEKLAHDLYLALNEVNPADTLYTIPTNAESKHMQYVEDLVAWYDLNITNVGDYNVSYSAEELAAMAPGEFAIAEIQDLYDDLYTFGVQDLTTSLQAGCMVEVVDVDDLLMYLTQAEGNPALIDSFTILLLGSYKHYWAFDTALKDLGVANGCCSLGAEYCKTTDEYPDDCM